MKWARGTQREQHAAELRRDFTSRRRRHAAAITMWIVAAIIAIGHFFEHAGAVRIVSPTFQDLALGWPMAAAIAITAAVVYGR